jgi:hypothetical protein
MDIFTGACIADCNRTQINTQQRKTQTTKLIEVGGQLISFLADTGTTHTIMDEPSYLF